ncbi:MAG: hypothetical protein ACJAZM_000145 [Cyclobacteriaceae bacterium]|jgi:hypothetical protein
MKKYTLLSLLIISAFFGFSQKLQKYEDALPRILSLPSSGIPASLEIYLIDDPENASIYFQLGVVYYARFKDSNILTDYPYKFGNARKALENMLVAKRVVDEKDVKKNQEHYSNFGKYDSKGRIQVGYDTLNSLINASIPELQQFLANAPSVYESFTASFTHYNASHKLYTELLGEYTTINNLYLLYDDEMEQSFQSITEEYEKSLVAFENYRAAIDTFPIGYDQEMIISDLEVYRLDGMSAEINFLIPKILIWNYADWITETRDYIQKNIASMRTALTEEETRINKRLDQIESDFIRESFKPLKITKETLFTLRKFDLQSVIESLFLFKEAKHDMIHTELQSKDLETSEVEDATRQLFLYGELINKIKDTDTLLLNVRTRNNADNLLKYPQFLEQSYQGRQGISRFVRAESDELLLKQDEYVGKLASGVYQALEDNVIITEATYQKQKLPLSITKINGSDTVTFEALTTHKLKNFDGSLFIGGVKKNTAGQLVSYVSGITPEGKVGWYNEYNLTLDSGQVQANTRVAGMTAVPGGSAVILNISQPDYPETVNKLLLIDEGGQEQLNIDLALSDYPQTITFNDRNNGLLLTFSGRNFYSDVFESGELTIAKYNILGDEIWQQKVAGRIEAVDVVTTTDGFVIAGNYSQYRSPKGLMMRAGRDDNSVGAYILSVSNGGEITAMRQIDADQPLFVSKLYKVSEECINVLGSQAPYMTNAVTDRSETAAFIMITRDLEEIARRM